MIDKENNILNVKNFYSSLNYLKVLSETIKELMVKILFFNIFNQDYKKLEQFMNDGDNDTLINFIGNSYNDYAINTNYQLNFENQFYALNFILTKPKINDIKEYLSKKNEYNELDYNNSKTSENIDNNENVILQKEMNYLIKYPVIYSYLHYKDLINNGTSYLNKLKNANIINDFENYLLHYFDSNEKI